MAPGQTFSTVQKPGNRVFEIALGEIADELAKIGEQLGFGRTITVDRAVQGGSPVVANTRIPTRLVTKLLDEGITPRALMSMYPELGADGIQAARDFKESLAQAG